LPEKKIKLSRKRKFTPPDFQDPPNSKKEGLVGQLAPNTKFIYEDGTPGA